MIHQLCTQLYLGNIGITDFCHDVGNELQNKETSIQAAEIEFVFHVIIYYLSSAHHVLESNAQKRGQGCLSQNFPSLTVMSDAGDICSSLRNALFSQNIHTLLVTEVLPLIPYLNPQNISLNSEHSLVSAGVKCVHPQADVLISTQNYTSKPSDRRLCIGNRPVLCQGGTKPMLLYWPSEGAVQQCRTRLQKLKALQTS